MGDLEPVKDEKWELRPPCAVKTTGGLQLWEKDGHPSMPTSTGTQQECLGAYTSAWEVGEGFLEIPYCVCNHLPAFSLGEGLSLSSLRGPGTSTL